MSMEDVYEIQKLMYSYCWLIDAGDLDGVCELMKDADVASEGRVYVHRDPEKYRKFFLSDVMIHDDGTPKTSHMCINPVVEVAPDGLTATGKSYTVVVQGVTGQFFPRIVWVDRKLDTFVKEDGKWKFRTRNFVTRAEGDVTEHLKSAHAKKNT